jgi:cytochrome c oxidase cbb3-type subunit 3
VKTRTLAVVCAVMLALGLAACEREQRRFSEVAPSSGRPERLRQHGFNPGDSAAPAEVRNPYAGNAWATAEGKQLYSAFNCVGCHANGGGGMGPPLIDTKWIYGGEPQDIYASIVEGRTNGMPAFGGKLTDAQAWQLVAYVQSLSGQLRRDVRPTRSDDMSARPSEQSGMPKPEPRR